MMTSLDQSCTDPKHCAQFTTSSRYRMCRRILHGSAKFMCYIFKMPFLVTDPDHALIDVNDWSCTDQRPSNECITLVGTSHLDKLSACLSSNNTQNLEREYNFPGALHRPNRNRFSIFVALVHSVRLNKFLGSGHATSTSHASAQGIYM